MNVCITQLTYVQGRHLCKDQNIIFFFGTSHGLLTGPLIHVKKQIFKSAIETRKDSGTR